MFNLLKKYFVLIQNIIFSILILPLLFTLAMVNTENIYQFNIGDIYTMVYFIYLFIGIILIYLSRYITNWKYKFLKDELLYSIKFVFFFSIFLIPSFFMIHNFIFEHMDSANLYLRGYGRIAFLYMALSLSISPILTFIKKDRLRDTLILSRKIFGIISFIYFIKHGLEYFSLEYIFQTKYNPNYTYLEYVYKNLPDRYDAITGILAGVLMLVLGLTSNKISMKLFGGKVWKGIQSVVYPAFLLSIIHIAYSGRIDNFYITLLVTVIGLRTLSYIVDSSKKTDGPTTKYICIPCGFIYDENIGDPDGGLEPGTKFEDIPDDRRCPVCGVTKSDFEPYYEGDNTVFGGFLGDVVGYKMLTNDVLELTLQPESNLDVNPGQYASIILKDFDGEFTRSYSISEKKGTNLMFTIKLKPDGRGGRQLKRMKIGETLKIKGIYGDFVLKNTPNPKVFIATGTGLAPVYNMMISNSFSKENQVFFGLQKKEDIFYEEKLKNIKDLEINIYLSREEVNGYKYGRMDLSKINFNKHTEFYLCGSPGLVQAASDNLKERGYENVYSEKFN